MQHQWARGWGGAMRSRLPGSRFLVASSVSSAGQQVLGANTVGISETYAKRMIDEMVDSGLLTATQMREMAGEKLNHKGGWIDRMKKGERIAGLLMRHPFIGAYSIQKTMFQLVNEKGPVVIVPEISATIRGRDGSAKQLKLGHMLGLAGDYDFDALITAFVNPNLEKKYAQEMGWSPDGTAQSRAYADAMFEHQIRYQMLSLDNPDINLKESISNVMEAAGKMQVADDYIGRVSNEMTKTKFAAMHFLQGKERADVFALTEWLEQKPISAKHANPEALAAQVSRLESAFRNPGKAEDLANVIKGFVKEGSNLGVTLTDADVDEIYKQSGYRVNKNIRGFDIDEIAKNITYAITEAKRRELPLEQATLKGTARGAAADTGYRKLHGNRGPKGAVGSIIAQAEVIASNALNAAGKSAIANSGGIKAAMAIGSLVGVAGILSGPSEMVGPGSQFNDRAKIKMNASKAAKRVQSQDIKPPRAPLGNPMGPSMLSQRRAMIASKPVETNHYMVKAKVNHPADASLVSQQLQMFTSLGNSINMSVRDTRSITNSYVRENNKY